MINLTFIRHTSVDVPPGVCYGQTDVPLAPSFPEEALIVKDGLAGIHFDEIYCSPLSRCVRLAEYCGFTTPKFDKRLMEMNFGEWEMIRYDKITDPRLQEWYLFNNVIDLSAFCLNLKNAIILREQKSQSSHTAAS